MLTYRPFQSHTIRDEFKENLANLLNCVSEYRLRKFLTNNGFSLNRELSIRYPSEIIPFDSSKQLKLVWDNEITRERIISPIFETEIVFNNRENYKNPYTVRCYKMAAVDLYLRRNKIIYFPQDKHYKETFETPNNKISRLSLLYFFKAFYENRITARYLAYILGFEQTNGNSNMIEFCFKPKGKLNAKLNPQNNRFPIRIFQQLYQSPCDELMLICNCWRRVIADVRSKEINILKLNT